MEAASEELTPATIVASGALGADDARQLKDAVGRASDAGEGPVVLDLSAVTAIDALALGAILALDSELSATGGSLEVIPPAGTSGASLRLLGGAGRLSFRSGA